MRQLILTGATLIADAGAQAVADAAVILEGDEIRYAGARAAAPVAPGAQAIDCSGCTIVPGFWNAHVHFFERKWTNANAIPADELQEQLLDFGRFGFTNVFDLSSALPNTQALRARIESGEVAGPRILTTGPGLVPPGAMPPEAVSRVMGLAPIEMPMVSAAASAQRAVDAASANGADAIKIFASGNAPGTGMEPSVMAAAVTRARERELFVFVHVNTDTDVARALECGAGVIAHTTPRTPWTQRTLEAIRSSDAALTPTLMLWQEFARHDRVSAQKQTAQSAAEQLHAWIECARPVLFGTDYGATQADPLREYELMEAAGMTFRDILRSLTAAPAKLFAKGRRTGRLAAGYEADVVVLKGDPQRDLRALTQIHRTFRSGRELFAAASAV